MTTEKMSRILGQAVQILLLIGFIWMMFTISAQRTDIEELHDASLSHDEMFEFMQKGKRFTYTDGRVLFLMCNGFDASDRVKGRAKGIYKEHGSTGFYEWLQYSNYLE